MCVVPRVPRAGLPAVAAVSTQLGRSAAGTCAQRAPLARPPPCPQAVIAVHITRSWLLGSWPQPVPVCCARPPQRPQAIIAIRITRFWGYHLLNTVLPVRRYLMPLPGAAHSSSAPSAGQAAGI